MRIERKSKTIINLDSVDNPQPVADWDGKLHILPHRITASTVDGRRVPWVVIHGQRILKSGRLSDAPERGIVLDIVETKSFYHPAPQWILDLVDQAMAKTPE